MKDPNSSDFPGETYFAPGRTDPDVVSLFKGWACLSTAPHGDIPDGRLLGFSVAGTCMVDFYRFSVNGRPPRCTFGVQLSADRWSGVFVVPDSAREGDLRAGSIPVAALDLTIARTVADGWAEELTIRNYSARSRVVEVAFEWNCPLIDAHSLSPPKGDRKAARPGMTADIAWESGVPAFHYRRAFGRRRRAPTVEFRSLLGHRAPKDGDPVERSLKILLASSRKARARVNKTSGRTELSFRASLGPQSHWRLRIDFVPRVDGTPLERSHKPSPDRTRIRTGNPIFNRILARAENDLDALILPALSGAVEGERTPPGLNAGVPRYIGIFGRDILTAGWQASLLSNRYLEDALARVALYQGVTRNDWRDEEPGRILHERRGNPDAVLGRSNRELYFGDVAATPFWVVTLASAYNWNGSREFLERHAGTLERCCRWIRDRLKEGNGFVYYHSKSNEPNRNQGWKDSGDAIVDSRGKVHVPPLAVVEVQGYCFLALLGAAEMSLARRDLESARALYREAMSLRERFNRAFWLPRENFFAMALARSGKPVDGIGSNVGHCLGCGIVAANKAPLVARRLLAPDMFSGWGIRTLSTDNPAYDPFSYHRGSVWPVENGTISAGLRLFGCDAEAERVIRAQVAAATCFPGMRLPEVISGHPRTEQTPSPGLYPEANLLQAWSVSSVLFIVWVLLGLRPLAPLRTLLVRPYLPDWLPWLELSHLRVGDALVSLTFWRTERGRVRWKILEKRGRLLVLEQPLEMDPGGTLERRLRDALRSVV